MGTNNINTTSEDIFKYDKIDDEKYCIFTHFLLKKLYQLDKQNYMKYRKINNHKKRKKKWNQNL